MARSGDDFFMPAADNYRLQRRLVVSEPAMAVSHLLYPGADNIALLQCAGKDYGLYDDFCIWHVFTGTVGQCQKVPSERNGKLGRRRFSGILRTGTKLSPIPAGYPAFGGSSFCWLMPDTQ